MAPAPGAAGSAGPSAADVASFSMPPPKGMVKKRDAPDGGGEERSAKKICVGEDLPEEISQEDIQSMLDQADELHIENLNPAALKRMVLQFERKIKRNQEMRVKHADEPEKFLKTEVDLDEEIKKFTSVATYPDLYSELVQLGALPMLVSLLNHVNTDIAVEVFEVLSELTDPDVIAEVPEPEDFVQALFDAQLCQMSVDVLLRINEDNSEEDAKAVSNCLTMIENLAEISPAETCNGFAKIPKLLPWLIKRVRATGDVDYNRVYASEILGIVLQNSEAARETMVSLDGVDKLLRGIAVYRKRDPGDSEESEFVQNMFGCLCSLMLLPAHQATFGKVQGIELMIRMMRERTFACNLALRLTDHSLRHCPANCEVFVEKLGLKTLFSMFMKKGPKLKAHAEAKEVEEHVVSIVQSLCRYCTGTATARVLNKFTENQFEKLERLLEMHEEYMRSVGEADAARVRGETKSIDRDLEVDAEEQLFLDRCDAGLFTLQQVDVILLRLGSMGNKQVVEEMVKLMDLKGVDFSDVRSTVEEYCSHLSEKAGEEQGELQRYLRTFASHCGVPEPEEAARPPKQDEERRKEGDEAASVDAVGDRGEAKDDEKAKAKKEKKEKKEKKDKRD